MKPQLDSRLENLVQTKTYTNLSESELAFVESSCTQEEYENYYLLFQEIDTHINNSDLEIPREVKDTIFTAFKNQKEKENKKIWNRPFLKPIIGLVAAALILLVITISLSEKDTTIVLTNNEFNSYTQTEEFAFSEEELDEVTLTLKKMEITELEAAAPSCDW